MVYYLLTMLLVDYVPFLTYLVVLTFYIFRVHIIQRFVRRTDAAGMMIMTQCLSSNLRSADQLVLSCAANDLSPAAILYIERSFVAVGSPSSPSTVSGKQTDLPASSSCTDESIVVPKSDDCVIGDVTDDFISACATFVSCRIPRGNSYGDAIEYSRSNCDLHGDLIYVTVHYDCLPVKAALNTPLNDASFIFMTSPVAYSFTNAPSYLYMATSGYPTSWSSARSRCVVRLPVNSSAIWTILDARGKTVNASADQCPYQLRLSVGEVLSSGSEVSSVNTHEQWCVNASWSETTFQINNTGLHGLDVGVQFDPNVQATRCAGAVCQGKMWLSVKVSPIGADRHGAGLSSASIDVNCGPNVTIAASTQQQNVSSDESARGLQYFLAVTEQPTKSESISASLRTDVLSGRQSNDGTTVVVWTKENGLEGTDWSLIVAVVAPIVGLCLLIAIVAGLVIAVRRRRSRLRQQQLLRARKEVIMAWHQAMASNFHQTAAAGAGTSEAATRPMLSTRTLELKSRELSISAQESGKINGSYAHDVPVAANVSSFSAAGIYVNMDMISVNADDNSVSTASWRSGSV